MEKPHEGKVQLNISFGYAQIIVPISRSITTKGYYSVFMLFWAIGLLVVSTQFLSGPLMEGNAAPFLLIWIGFWAASGLALMRKWIWIMFGKEVITIERSELKIERKNLLFHKTKTYLLQECQRFTTYYHGDDDDDDPFGARKNFWKVKLKGTIMFDYGMKTIEFCDGVDMAEGRHILLSLAEKEVIKPENILEYNKLKADAASAKNVYNDPKSPNYWKPE